MLEMPIIVLGSLFGNKSNIITGSQSVRGGSMARIVKEIKVEGKRLKVLFDSGSLRS
jgi:hypothetical protein